MIVKHWWHASLTAWLVLACSDARPRAPADPGENSTSESSDTSTVESESSDGSTASGTDDRSDGSAFGPDGSPAGSDGGTPTTETPDSGFPENDASLEPDSGPPPPVTGRYDAGPTPDGGIAINGDCSGDRAFLVTGGAFIDPTPTQVALRLNQDIFGEPPLTLVLLNEAEPARMAASYSVATPEGHAFLSLKPDFVAARANASGFTTEHPQLNAWMWLERDAGPVELPLQNVHVTATAVDACTRVLFTLSAVIRPEDYDLIGTRPELDAGSEPRQDHAPETSVRAIFEAELTQFDFGSLP